MDVVYLLELEHLTVDLYTIMIESQLHVMNVLHFHKLDIDDFIKNKIILTIL